MMKLKQLFDFVNNSGRQDKADLAKSYFAELLNKRCMIRREEAIDRESQIRSLALFGERFLFLGDACVCTSFSLQNFFEFLFLSSRSSMASVGHRKEGINLIGIS